MRNTALRATFVAALATAGIFAGCHHNSGGDTNPQPAQKSMITDAGVGDGMVSNPSMLDATAMASSPELEVAQAEPMAGDGGISPTHMPGTGTGSGSGGNRLPSNPGPIVQPNNPTNPGGPTTPVPAPAPGTPTPGGPTPPPPPINH